MQNIAWKVVLIIAVLALCAYALYPPKERIRLGKDLSGGYSLVYLVNMPADTPNKAEVLDQTIKVLKDRVDPRGILDISMQPLGVDRIEMVSPLPSDEVKRLKAEFDTALKGLVSTSQVAEDDLDEALRSDRAPQQFPESEAGRSGKMVELQKAFNEFQDSRQGLVEARGKTRDAAQTQPDATTAPETQPAATSPESLELLEQRVADAQDRYETLRAEVLNQSLDLARVVRTLALSTERRLKTDEKGNPVLDENGKEQRELSPREAALQSLKAQFPQLSGKIDAVVAAHDVYQSKRTTLDDPEDLMRLLRGAGVLEFHIAVRNSGPENLNIDDLRKQLAEVGPDRTDSPMAAWFPVNDLRQFADEPAQQRELDADPQGYFAARYDMAAARYNGQVYILLYTTPTKAMVHTPTSQWSVESTFRSVDRLGRPAVSFRLDAAGGTLMARLTGAHINQPMAIVLDGQLYSAPNINSQIGNSGVIEGQFSQEDINYLTRVLAAGSLSARLSERPIAINTLGPSIGADNLARGLKAFVLSIIVTAALMMGYYFFAGFIANVALCMNAIIIFGVMAMIDGTFTLPGLAGIALAIAMAVDANVLIYERIREELVNHHEDLRTAIRLGYSRAMSAIIDGNVTHLITCVVLLYTATTEVKGFALTMILGVAATLFTALFVTRVLYTFYTEYFNIKTLPMLPTVFPAIHKALEPHIDWIGKRRIFFTLSAVVTLASLGLMYSLGNRMLDTEFRGGVSLTMQTRKALPREDADNDKNLRLSRPAVEAEIRAIGDKAGPGDAALHELRNASVLTVGEITADYKASRFQVKVSNPPNVESEAVVNDAVETAIARAFRDRLEVTPELDFSGQGDINHNAHVFPIDSDVLGENINVPDARQSVRQFRGGVAIVVRDISPAITTEQAERRIQDLRDKPDFTEARGRAVRVIALQQSDPNDPAKGASAIAVVVYDPDLDLRKVDVGLWDDQLARMEWRLVSTAFATGSSFQEVSSFSSAIARTLAANAIVAVVLSLLGMLIYIWVRFGSLRYSIATVVALAHCVIVCLGAIALTHYIADTRIAQWLMLDEMRIDLNVIAALLTIIGYSLNDTIVILDRIRENRGKRLFATPQIVNDSVNQTFSRTILTGGSTIMASVILYVLGGTGIQPFAFTFLVGLLVGTYGSVAIAAPLVVKPPDADAGAAAVSGSLDAPPNVAAA